MKTVFKKNATNVLGEIVSKITENELTVWPPVCMGLFYQPQRPVIDNQETKPEEK